MTEYVIVAETVDGVYKVLVRPHTDMYDPEFYEVADLTRRPKLYRTLEGAKQRCEAEQGYFVRRKIFPRLSVWTWVLLDVAEKVWEPK